MSKKTSTKSTKKPTQLDRLEKAWNLSAVAMQGFMDEAADRLQIIQSIVLEMRDKAIPQSEVASHKAKEEQRAKEAEWAKFDELQDGDACAATSEEQDKVIAMSKDAGFLKGYTSSYREPEGLTWKPDTYPDSPLQFGIHSSNVMPFTEWERRLRGTIAKRAEEERAKQLAKPLEMGMKVRTKEYGEGFYWFLNDSPSDGFHRIILPGGNVATVLRDQFTIID